jgi:hypothetical protein
MDLAVLDADAPTAARFHLATVPQMVTSSVRTATVRRQLVLLGRLAQLTVVAYLKVVWVVIAERLWTVDDELPARKESSS